MSEPTISASDIDPVVRAAAELHAREAGQTLSQYLAGLVFNQPTAEDTEAWPEKSTGHQWRLSRHWADSEDFRHWNMCVRETLLSNVSASPTLKLVFIFNSRLHSAALLMGAAFHEASVSDFKLPRHQRSSVHPVQKRRNWYSHIVDDCLARSREVRQALLHRWTPTPRAEQLAIDAFVLLTELTPARTELLRLCQYDRPRAFSELAKHIDLAADQFQLSADLLAEVEGGTSAIELSDEQRFDNISTALLDRSGGGVSLTEGARVLGTTRQALHKRVKLGSAFGLMHGSEIVLPKFQFVTIDNKTRLLDGLAKVTKLFDDSGAGRWSMLQFLIDTDPNLAGTPQRILAEGRVSDVVAAAKAYLGVDEG
ncbi:conserved hypothetical protein [Agrobacterium tumefaciens str. Kerr 14]|uniref:Antitoxin Xre/MbcA/ParS-like toxin-binding domain-containing protein n=1 Tax=Agrobacterium tumefaciens str. Kerr 14 TaxID=1183424 RepID=A0A1S7SCS1_AGRTU|nr:hypothetical protein [Agrobacterium tumefaciens]CUX65948.1 conserved hypothetical protein [Agrobacterium tumefaciens str. Kerr 14]